MSSIVDRIIEETDIVSVIGEHVSLEPKGKNYVGLCPFHQDNNPSCTVSPEKKIYKCFVCENGGNVITFLQRYNHISYDESISKLADNLGLEYKKQKQLVKTANARILDSAAAFYNTYLTTIADAGEAREYLNNRSVDQKLQDKFKIGYSPKQRNILSDFLKTELSDLTSFDFENSTVLNEGNDFFSNRLIFPIMDDNGNTVAFSGRVLNGSGPKYLNSRDSVEFDKSSVLYNMNNAKQYIDQHEIYIVEGFFDVLAFYKQGIFNVVATMGTSFTSKHVQLLKKYKITKVVLCLDQDEPGLNSMMKIGNLLLENDFTHINVVQFNGFKDVDEYVESGLDLKELMLRNIDYFEFKMIILKEMYDINNLDDKTQYIKSVLKHINKIELHKRNIIVNQLSGIVDIDPNFLVSDISNNNVVTTPSVVNKKLNSNSITTDDVIIKYCLESREKFLKVKNAIDNKQIGMSKYLDLYQVLNSYYDLYDVFDIIDFLDVSNSEQFDRLSEIQKKTVLDEEKFDQLLNGNVSRKNLNGISIFRNKGSRR